ncbi:hypothetical protein HDZ31DRAFT_51959, partial [Schizophyllum fasciatum]
MRLMRTFDSNSSLGQHERKLSLYSMLPEQAFAVVQRIMAHTPNLTILKADDTSSLTNVARSHDAPTMRWSQFTALPSVVPELQELKSFKIVKEFVAQPRGASTQTAASNAASTSAGDQISVPLGALTPFRSLVVLHFEVSVKLKFKKGDVPRDAFPVLKDLHLRSCHTSILKLFTLFELPALRCLGLYSRAQTGQDAGDFLEAHGPNIQELDIQYFPTESVLGMCSALQTLHVRERKP